MKLLGYKTLCRILAVASLATTAPAMAQQVTGNGSGTTNIWSSAQGTSNSYGAANGFGNSSSGTMITTGGQGLNGLASSSTGSTTQLITTSSAGTSSSGSGYAQSQTSGYAGGNISGFGSLGLPSGPSAIVSPTRQPLEHERDAVCAGFADHGLSRVEAAG